MCWLDGQKLKGKKWTNFSPFVWIFGKENGKKLISCMEKNYTN